MDFFKNIFVDQCYFIDHFTVLIHSKQNFLSTVHIFAPVQTDPGAHPASITIDIGGKVARV